MHVERRKSDGDAVKTGWSRILALCFSCAYHTMIHEIIMKNYADAMIICDYVVNYGI